MSDLWEQRRAKHRGQPVPEGLKHGQNSWAKQAYGCECSICLPTGRRRRPNAQGKDGRRRSPNGQGKSNAERQAEFRKYWHGKPVPPWVQHGAYCYRNYGCRCDLCMAGNRDRQRSKRKAWAKNAQGSWVAGNNGLTTVHWPPRGEGWWECPDCHEKFEMRRPAGAA